MTQQHLHTTMTGHELRFAARPEVDAFITRLAAMEADDSVTERDMAALAFTTANPLLGPVPGDPVGERGFVNAEVLADPAFRVMTDLMARKRFREQGVDPATVAATFTVSTSEAAEQAGVSVSAIRQAIAAGRLPSWVKGGGQHFMHPDAVRRFAAQAAADASKGSRRGPRAATTARPPLLAVCTGHGDGKSFRVKYPGELMAETRAGGNYVEGQVPVWSRIAVLSGHEKPRLFILVPGPDDAEIAYDGGYVHGRFTIAETVNNPKRAREMFNVFEAT